MKTVFVISAAFMSILSLSAFAQDSDHHRGGYSDQSSSGDHEDQQNQQGRGMGPMMGMGRIGSMMGSMGRMGSMRATTDVARFRFRQGDTAMDVRCPSTETLQDCVRAASQLLARFNGMPASAPAKEQDSTKSQNPQ